jgi:hypothetical protein
MVDGRTLNRVATLAAAVALVFGIVAAAGASYSIPWTVMRSTSLPVPDIYFGLLEYRDHGVTVRYEDSPWGFATRCKETGENALAFAVIACVGELLVIVALVRLLNNGGSKVVPMLLMLGVSACFIVSWASWVGGCHERLKDSYLSMPYSTRLDAGFALAFLGFCLTAVAFIVTAMAGEAGPDRLLP